jgi:hypothetical protein
MERQQSLNGTQAKWFAVFEKIDARWHKRIDGELETGAELGLPGFSKLRPRQSQSE